MQRLREIFSLLQFTPYPLANVFILFGAIVILRGLLFRTAVTYTIDNTENRRFEIKDAKLKNYVETHADVFNRDLDTITTIAQIALRITADLLTESNAEGLSIDPNITSLKGEANSEGYAMCFNTICTYLIEKQGLAYRYRTRQYAGRTQIQNRNTSDLFRSPYSSSSASETSNFVGIEDDMTGVRWFYDPLLYDKFVISKIVVQGYDDPDDYDARAAHLPTPLPDKPLSITRRQ